ncbi:MAG: biotin--[acetyl-CoA-carboxylase] ligase [Nitrosopumilus sp.]
MYNSLENPGLLKVLTFLQTHNTEYLSGQDLSDVLKISRVAVWKHIKKIQELGYTIESKQKLGYKLVANSEELLPWEITKGLKTKLIGQRVYYYESLDSTQNQALKITKDVNNDGILVVAAKQTRGKGRSGRRWVSPKGGIWVSIILFPKFDISITTLFPIASSLALSYAIEKIFKISPELKWPNDVTIKGKKVAGMLVDVSLESNKIESLVLGVGINFNINTKEVKEKLKNTPNFYGVTTLTDKNKNQKAIKLIQSFLTELEKIYYSLNKKRIEQIISEWTKRSSTIGKKIELETINGKITGKAIKIDYDGALIISNNDKIERIIAGDIRHTSK